MRIASTVNRVAPIEGENARLNCCYCGASLSSTVAAVLEGAAAATRSSPFQVEDATDELYLRTELVSPRRYDRGANPQPQGDDEPRNAIAANGMM